MERLTGYSPDIAKGYIAIGRINGPWGLRGEVKVTLHTDFPERFQDLSIVYLGPEARPVRLLSSRLYKGQILLRLEGYADRTAAEELRGQWVQIPREEVVPLPEGEHYAFELIGLRVLTTDGRDLGEIVEILFTGANEVFVVRSSTGEVLIPYVRDVVVREDLEAGTLWVEPIPGLLE